MKVLVILADKGSQNPQGTLNLLGAGWTQTSLLPAGNPAAPGMQLTPSQAVAIFYEVEPHRCNHPIELLIELWTQDGHVVELPGPAGPQPLRLQQNIVVATPGGVPTGSPGTGNTLLELIQGLPLAPGGYEWRVSLDGQHEAEWNATFFVVAPPQAPVFGAPSPPPSSPE